MGTPRIGGFGGREHHAFADSKRSPRFLASSVCAARGAARRCAGPHRENWPEVGVPSGPRASSRAASASPAALRAAVPTGGRRSKRSPRFFASSVYAARGAPRRCADRRSAFPAVPALLRERRCVACGAARRGADRRSAFQAVPAILREQRLRRPRRSAPRCRPEVGVPSGPRDSSRAASAPPA